VALAIEAEVAGTGDISNCQLPILVLNPLSVHRKENAMATAKKPAAKKAAPAKKAAAKKAPAKKAVTAKKAPAKKVAAKKAPAKKVAAKKAAKPRTPNASFMKAMTPSAALAAVIGAMPSPRTEITKKLWAYIKKNSLQDAVNKRMINADAKLKEIFGKAQVSMFEMTKLIQKHMK